MKSNKDLQTVNVRCPKCKSNHEIELSEFKKGQHIQYFVNSGNIDVNDVMYCDGYPFQVKGECMVCGHKWTVKNVKNIDDCIKK